MNRIMRIVLSCILLMALSGCSTQYKRISFGGEGALGDAYPKYIDESTQVIVTPTEVFPKQIPIYRISERKITKLELQKMKENLGIQDADVRIELDGNELIVTLANYPDSSRGYLDMTDEELEKAAWEVFEKLPFMDGEYKYLGIWSSGTISNSSGTHKTRVGVSFRRHLDDVRILGEHSCILHFDGSGLQQISVKLYDYQKIGTMDVISVESLAGNIKTADQFTAGPKDESQTSDIYSTMQVEEIVPILMNQYSNGCTILQPVYSFVGTATDNKGVESEFNAWVIAIPEKYTYEEKE